MERALIGVDMFGGDIAQPLTEVRCELRPAKLISCVLEWPANGKAPSGLAAKEREQYIS